MNQKRLFLAVVFVVCLAAIGYGLYWVASHSVEEVVEPVAPSVDMSMQGVELTRSASDGSRWTLVAKSADYHQDEALVDVHAPTLTWERQNEEPITVTADEGRVNQESGEAEMWPNVVIVSGENTVYAKQLNYSDANRELVLTKDVRIEREGMDLEAPRVRLDLTTNEITATGGVTAVLIDSKKSTAEE